MKKGKKIIILKNLKPAKRYSLALIEASKDNNVDFDIIKEELFAVIKTLEENPDFKNFMLNPTVSKKDKIDTVKQIFGEKISDTLQNFLYTTINNERFYLINEVYESFISEVDSIRDIVNAEITSSIELDDELKGKILTKLEEKLKRKIEAHFENDKEIMGGLVIKIKDTIIDLSLKTKIENLKRM